MQNVTRLPDQHAQPKERRELAAAYRLVAHFGLDDSIFTHISASAPRDEWRAENEHAFLINPFGLRFNEVQASNLVTVGLDGDILHDTFGAGINQAGFTIHSAVHAARPEIRCVIHTHTVAGVAISSIEEGLLPLNQWSLQFHDRIAYHDYEGIALDLSERERLIADMGDRRVMMLRNHGILTAGRTIGEAFTLMFNLERSCRAQVAALSMNGVTPRLMGAELAEKTARQYEGWDGEGEEPELDEDSPQVEWAAYMRLAETLFPDFAD